MIRICLCILSILLHTTDGWLIHMIDPFNIKCRARIGSLQRIMSTRRHCNINCDIPDSPELKEFLSESGFSINEFNSEMEKLRREILSPENIARMKEKSSQNAAKSRAIKQAKKFSKLFQRVDANGNNNGNGNCNVTSLSS